MIRELKTSEFQKQNEGCNRLMQLKPVSATARQPLDDNDQISPNWLSSKSSSIIAASSSSYKARLIQQLKINTSV